MITQENIPYTADEIKAMVKTCEKYNKALERARELMTKGYDFLMPVIFPELAESEDERIRKEIIDFLELPHPQFVGKRDHEKWIAWLEKQGEKKSADEVLKIRQELYQSGYNDGYKHGQEDITKSLSIGENINHTDIKEKAHQIAWETSKDYDPSLSKEAWCEMAALDMASWLKKQGEQTHGKPGQSEVTKTSGHELEPKFHEGDWIISNNKKSIYQVIEVKRGIYVIRDNVDNHEYYIGIEECEKSGRLWTISDAKDGDVLSFYLEYKGNKMVQIGIIEKYVGKHGGCSNTFKVYVGVDWENNFQIGKYMGCSDIRPATKEQRDLLFSKMKQAGYEWRQEEKKLIKINEQKFKVGDWITGGYIHCKITEILDDRYIFESKYDKRGAILFEHENRYHLWTINDANDGDVLATENFIFIFKNIDDGNGVHYYCQYEISKHENDNQFDIALPQSLMGRVGNSISHYSPATKEQRDLLFAKMKEAGYEWNTENKELKKIESKMLDADKVIEWMKHRELSCDDVVITVIPDDSPTSVPHRAKWLSDEFVKQFKKDFGL